MFIRQSILIRILGRGHTQLNNIYYEMFIYQSLLITVGPSEGGGYTFDQYNHDYNKKWNRWKEFPIPIPILQGV